MSSYTNKAIKLAGELEDARQKIRQLEQRIDELKKIESFNVEAIRALEDSETRYRAVVDVQTDLIDRHLVDCTLTFVNDAYCNYYGKSREELIGRSFLPLIPEDNRRLVKKQIQRLNRNHPIDSYEARHGTRWHHWIRQAIFSPEGKILEFQAVGRDITHLKEIEDSLKISQQDLRYQKDELERKNIALCEVLKQIEADKNQVRKDIIRNVEEFLFPVLQRLKSTGLSLPQSKYVDLFEDNLQRLIAPFGRKLSNRQSRLTARELEICNMIRGGLTGKEIADLLHLAYGTVESHRNRIRRKLGLVKSRVNLFNYLQSLE